MSFIYETALLYKPDLGLYALLVCGKTKALRAELLIQGLTVRVRGGGTWLYIQFLFLLGDV